MGRISDWFLGWFRSSPPPARPPTIRHHYASTALEQGVFDEVRDAQGLVEAIRKHVINLGYNLSQPGEWTTIEGHAFEVFCEWYISWNPAFQAVEVWPQGNVPEDVLLRLNLPEVDEGYDGVYRDVFGDYHTYQAKYRYDSAQTIPWSILDSFAGISAHPEIRSWLLLTTVTNVDRWLSVRDGVDRNRAVSNGLHDLILLQPEAFDDFRTWLSSCGDAEANREPFTLREDQETVVCDLVNELNDNGSRANIAWACGTGKTAVGAFTLQRLRPDLALVLVPSLQLLNQTLLDYHLMLPDARILHLCVCSMADVEARGEDSGRWVSTLNELGFRPTTDPEDIRRFIRHRHDGLRVVFSTYRSCHAVAAAMEADEWFDVAVFDEAHHTVGWENRQGLRPEVRANFAMSDERIRIHRRLFMTATPKTYHPTNPDRATASYSMDNPDHYGRRVSELSFRRGAELGIIAEPQILVIAVDANLVAIEELHHGAALDGDEGVDAFAYSRSLALRMAVDEVGARKVFSFHNSLADAREFAEDGTTSASAVLGEGWNVSHIHGNLRMRRRRRLLYEEFEPANRALMTNYRVLTEGVNIPAVDMVAFMSPRHSPIDIAQAMGRALRRPTPEKEVGYIVVPFLAHVAEGQDFDEAAAVTGFDQLLAIVRAFRDQDAVMDEAIREDRRNIGRGRALRGARGLIRTIGHTDILPAAFNIEGDDLEAALWIALVERADPRGDNWEEMYGRLLRHLENPDVPRFIRNSGDAQLDMWSNNMRLARSAIERGQQPWGYKALTIQRYEMLSETGFLWVSDDPRSRGGAPPGGARRPTLSREQWAMLFTQFHQREGHSDVPQTHFETYDFVEEDGDRWYDENGNKYTTWPLGMKRVNLRRSARSAMSENVRNYWRDHTNLTLPEPDEEETD